MPLNVKYIDHVTIVSSDLERTRAFYVGLLGMAEVPRPAFSFPGVWFQAGKTQIHVNVASPEAGPAGSGLGCGTHPSRGLHIAFEVDHADTAVEYCKSKGVPIAVGPFNRPDGPRQFYIADPDGYLIEVFSMK